MKLEEYRKKEGLSFEALARRLNMTNSLCHRLCKGSDAKMSSVKKIHEKTGGQVSYKDFLETN